MKELKWWLAVLLLVVLIMVSFVELFAAIIKYFDLVSLIVNISLCCFLWKWVMKNNT